MYDAPAPAQPVILYGRPGVAALSWEMLAEILSPVCTFPWNGLKNNPSPPGCCTLANPSDDIPSLKGPEMVLLATAFQLTGVARTCVETAALSISGFARIFWARAEPTQTISAEAP